MTSLHSRLHLSVHMDNHKLKTCTLLSPILDTAVKKKEAAFDPLCYTQ